MAIQLTIVGLGQIGASIGLALIEKKDLIFRVGHDKDLGIARRAEKLSAIDRVEINLPRSVEQADIVVLSLPMDQVQETLRIIAPDLKHGGVVIDTSPLKEPVAAWAKEYLPEGRHYVGLTPAINPAYFDSTGTGLDIARADLFVNGIIAIVAPPGSDSGAIKLTADLTQLLGAKVMFFDGVEIDSLMAATHQLPQLLSAALLDSTVTQPGWHEARKVAGRAYAQATEPIRSMGTPSELQSSLLLNKANTLRVIDNLIATLEHIRTDIEQEDAESVTEKLEQAQKRRSLWLKQRTDANWAAEEIEMPTQMPTGSEVFGRLVGLGRKRKPKPKS